MSQPSNTQVYPDPSQDTLMSMSDEEEDEEYDWYYEDEFAVEDGLQTLPPSQSSNVRLVPAAIAQMRANEVDRISSILELDAGIVMQLLNHFKWNGEKLIEQYIDNPDKVFTDAGLEVLVGKASTVAPLSADMKYECQVCFEELPGDQMYKLACQHLYCVECWRNYLQNQIDDGNSIGMECMEYKCKVLVDEISVKKLVTGPYFDKYSKFMEASFVDTNPLIKWCPAPGCGNAVRSTLMSSRDVVCKCGFKFCFQCNREAHFPASCKEMELWKIKCEDDSETFNWLKSNTQDCPKCRTAIEKNGGCNHMTCRKKGCGYEFCWLCLGDYRNHGSCNRFDEAKQTEIGDARASLERYLHYFNRYTRHEQSKQFEQEMRDKALKTMESLVSSSERWMDTQFVLASVNQIIECRRVLKYTYVAGYYMKPGTEKNLYEYLQEDLEKTTDQLAEEIEKDADRYDRRKIIDLCNLSRRRLDNLMKGCEDGLTSVGSEGGSGSSK